MNKQSIEQKLTERLKVIIGQLVFEREMIMAELELARERVNELDAQQPTTE